MNEEEIFQVAVDTPATERANYLRTACEGQPALRQRVERLLASHDDDAFMQRPADRTVSAELETGLARLKPEEGEDRIGNYKLLQKIGEGGFGTVWMAEQLEPVRRRVALKIIKLGMDTREVIVRFEQERQALALMDHPNIAKVLDAGVTALGRPYFVMELVRGIRITDFCDQNNLTTSERLKLFIAVCNAIQHAHQKGIIHRDIKPSNILVTLHDGVPVPKVIDFGVAKAIQSQRLTDRTFFTRFEQMIGTPLYMSPEQAEMSGLDIDTRSDIYSLGVLLYELLTGRTPFDPEKFRRQGLDEMRRAIREQEPQKPSGFVSTMTADARMAVAKHRQVDGVKLIGQIRGDLDWIVMKALEKDRTRRYETANGLALDIQRYLQSEPVIARPPTPLYRFQKMVRRNQLPFAAAGAVVTALLVGMFLAFWQAIRATKAERDARLAERAEQTQADRARADRDRAVRAEAEIRQNAYAAEINVAFHALAENKLGNARELLDRQRPKANEKDLRGFEWRYLWQLCQGDEFATFPDEGTGAAAAFSPDGKLLVYSGSKIIVREATSLRLVTTLSEPATTLSFAPHTNLLATGDSSGVKLWDTKTWKEVRSLPEAIQPALFSPDGKQLLTGRPGGFQLWDTDTWRSEIVSQDAPNLRLQTRNAVAFSPDSQSFVTIAGKGLNLGDHLRGWQLPGLKELPEIRFESDPISVAYTSDGQHLIAGLWNGQVIVWDFATDQVRATLKEHAVNVSGVAMTSNGQTFATASVDGTINLWDARTFKPIRRLRGTVGRIWSLAISPDGGTVLSSNMEGTTRLWRTGERPSPPILKGSRLMAGFSSDGSQVVAGGSNGWCVWMPASGQRRDISVPSSSPVVDFGKPYDVKPGELIGAVGRLNGTVELWDLRTEAKVTQWRAHSNGISAVIFSPDGRNLATGTTDGIVKIWNLASQREVAGFGPVGCHFYCLAFSPDGNTLAGSGSGRAVWLWDIKSGQELRQLNGYGAIVGQVAFAPDGRLLATASFSGEVRLWELPSGAELPPLKGHVISVVGLAFSPDGKTLATGDGHKVILWNVATRQELTAIPTFGKFPMLSFSPDHRMLVLSERPETEGHILVLGAPSFEDIGKAEAP